jgi:general stress protein 26
MSTPVPSRRLVGDSILVDALVMELLDARLVGVFATFDEDGTIHAVPMWFASDERSILLATASRSRKVGNLEVDARSTLVIHDSRPGFEVCGASIAGHAEIVRGARAGPLVRRVHRRYVDEACELPEIARTFLESDDVALRFHLQSALVWDQRGGEANNALRATGRALPLVTTAPRD